MTSVDLWCVVSADQGQRTHTQPDLLTRGEHHRTAWPQHSITDYVNVIIAYASAQVGVWKKKIQFESHRRYV
jgi:hypothetical protein